MDPDFRSRLLAVCEELFASTRHHAVAESCRRVAAFAANDARERDAQYQTLREVVRTAARDAPLPRYTRLVALHDQLMHDAILVPDNAPAEVALFDEAFYLEMHEDIAAAVREGVHSSGFAHFVEWGSREGRQPHRWRADGPPVPTVPRRGTEARATWRRPGVDRAARAANADLGINLFGFHSANLGLGTTARSYYRFLVDAGFSVCPVDVPLPGGRSGHDLSYADAFTPLDRPTPHSTNLFVMNPPDVRTCMTMRYPAVDAGRTNVAMPFWELPRLPERWVPMLEGMDVVLAASTWIEHALRADVSGPVIRRVPHPLYLPDTVSTDRRRWQIPDGVTAFATMFEMASDVNRKNPFAGIEAFQRALGGDPRALLIIRVNQASQGGDHAAHFARLQTLQQRSPNVRVIADVREYGDALSLFASCDVFVSLHHAEGLGLCLMEAMALGKPVVTTAWSGNMDFTNDRNACLVGHDLVPVVGATHQYSPAMVRASARWAEARIDEAAEWMLRLVEEPELRRRIGDRAAADVADYQRRVDATDLATVLHRVHTRRSRTRDATSATPGSARHGTCSAALPSDNRTDPPGTDGTPRTR